MFNKENFRTLLIYILIVGLFILAFLVIKPVIFPIIYGLLFAYIIHPVYRLVLSKLQNKTLSSIIVCFSFFIIIALLLVLIFGAIFNQLITIYLSLQEKEAINITESSLFKLISPELSKSIASSIEILLSSIINKATNYISDYILNLPELFLQILVFILSLFFGLRDGKEAFEYLESLSPLEKEIQAKFFKHFKDITESVVIGQILIGAVQGIVAGIGYFIFGVPNALLLTGLTILVSIIPIIGPWLVWVPVDIYLFVTNDIGSGIGLFIYGVFLISLIDNIIRPVIVSKKTQINSGIVLIGMIGGILVFGPLGLIIGPLILAYILLVLELYKKRSIGENIIFQKGES